MKDGKEQASGEREEGGEAKKRGEKDGGICGLHFFKEKVAQDFWSEFFASNSSFGSHWAQRKIALNKFEF